MGQVRSSSFIALLAFSVGVPSLATAIGDARPLVVLDPGHGGAKTGAKTAEGVEEKAIVLAVAKHAARILERNGLVVLLTREDDRHVALRDRVILANRRGASAFVSVHANWSPVPGRRGVETYILSPEASDSEAAAVVHLENDDNGGEGAGFGGQGASGESDLEFILGDLERATAHQDSAALAKRIQDRLGKLQALAPSRGLRQAPFLVLRGADMPAALLELGYLSSQPQGGALATSASQKQAGEALGEAILAFVRDQRGKHASASAKGVD